MDSRIILVDKANELLVSIGKVADRSRPGWPNALDASGAVVRPPLVEGAFSTPHLVAVDQAGDIYVTEWLIGGRLVKLTRTN